MLSFGCTSVRQSVQQKVEQELLYVTERWLIIQCMETRSAKTETSTLQSICLLVLSHTENHISF